MKAKIFCFDPLVYSFVLCLPLISSTAALANTTPREIAKKVSPSVALLVMEDTAGQPISMGSGFVIRDGVIATNMHVIEGAARGYAKLIDDKSKHDIRGIVASDPARDLVLLSAGELKSNPLVIGDSNKVAVGDTVYAVGNPRGLEGTFSIGIISSIREVGDDSLLQITAPISPGSSGGPVLNSKGEVIGIAVATFKGGQNLNFAIPSHYLSALIPTIHDLVDLPKAAEARKDTKGKSILDEMGGKSIEGVSGEQFLWSYKAMQVGAYSLTLRNQLREHVQNVICLVVFYGKDGQPVDVDLITYRDLVPAGLARRVTSQVDSSVQELTTHRNTKIPHTRVEYRILTFDIVDPGEGSFSR